MASLKAIPNESLKTRCDKQLPKLYILSQICALRRVLKKSLSIIYAFCIAQVIKQDLEQDSNSLHKKKRGGVAV